MSKLRFLRSQKAQNIKKEISQLKIKTFSSSKNTESEKAATDWEKTFAMHICLTKDLYLEYIKEFLKFNKKKHGNDKVRTVVSSEEKYKES